MADPPCDNLALQTDMHTVAAKIKEELHVLLPPTIYFFIALHIVALVRVLMLEGTGIAPGTTVSVAVAALILGKAVLIADLLPFIDRYPAKPIVYNIAWKTTIYTLLATLLHYVERLIDHWREAGGFIAGNQKLLAEMVWPHFWAIQILLLVLVLLYCTGREFVRVVGEERARLILFGPARESP